MPSIFYTRTGPSIAGGHFVVDAHVAGLRELGYRAWHLYLPLSGSITRHNPGGPVVLWREGMAFSPQDCIVLPEPWKKGIEAFSPLSARKFVHCQNPYYLFHGFNNLQQIEDSGFEAMLSCSHFTTQTLRRIGYEGKVCTVRPFIPSIFSDNQEKRVQIAYMPRKRANEAVYIKGLFQSLYPCYADIPWVAIDGITRDEAAVLLGQSAIFASLSFTEGLGLPPLEAMASGCIVAGFTGLGGTEYARSDNGFWVEECDYFAFAHALGEALHCLDTPLWRDAVTASAQRMATQFSKQNFIQQLDTAWKDLLSDNFSEYFLDTY